MTAPDTITQPELAEAMRLQGYDREQIGALLAVIESNREPEYEPGETYADRDGNTWMFHSDDGKGPFWLAPGVRTPYDFGYPPRPLHKLIRLPSRDQVAAALTDDGRDLWREPLLARYTDRIMRLLEGEQ